MRKRTLSVLLLAAAMLLLTCAAGCSGPVASFGESTTSYNETSVAPLHLRASDSSLLGSPANDVPGLRHKALVEIRGTSPAGARAADLMTATFPATTRSVPVYVESALWKGRPALIVVELLGRKGSSLNDSRVWAIAPNGTVLYSAVR